MNVRVSLALLFLAFGCSFSAHATSFSYTATDSSLTITATLPSTPSEINTYSFAYTDIAGMVNGVDATISVYFWSEDDVSMDLDILDGDGNALVVLSGPDMYSGTIGDDAALVYDTYSVSGLYGPDGTVALGPDVSATPEPSSLALLGTGLLGGAGVLRRRFVR